MIIFKPGTRHTEHLQDHKVVDHRDVLDLVWKYRSAAPDANEFVDAMSQWHRWGALDQQAFYNAMAGPLAGKSIRLVACIPPAVVAMLHHYYPEVLKDREEFYKLLKAHPEWSVPEGVS